MDLRTHSLQHNANVAFHTINSYALLVKFWQNSNSIQNTKNRPGELNFVRAKLHKLRQVILM
jgi:hypothetical protein